MLVSDIQTRVKQTVGDDSGVIITDADILRWINDAQFEVVRQTDCLTKIATGSLDTTGVIALPADFYKTIRFVVKDVVLKAMSQQDIDRYGDQINQSGFNHNFLAGYFFVRHGNLYFNPNGLNGENYRLEYVHTPATLTTANETPVVPLVYHVQLVEYCLGQAWARLNEPNKAANSNTKFMGELLGLVTDNNWRHSDSYPVIRDAFGDGW